MFAKLAKTALLALGGTLAYQTVWGLRQVAARDVKTTLATHRNAAPPGVTFQSVEESDHFTRTHSVQDGIERIHYQPRERRFQTPILMQHGMWHGAWCWQTWQEALAEWGWESIAISQPGHAASPAQKPIEQCTLDYYLGFLKAEVDRLPRKPILMGHSMGGALTQWYLKYAGDLPAAVLVAPWPYQGDYETVFYLTMADPLGMLLSYLTRRAQQTRSPQAAAHALLSPDSIYTPEAFHARLGPESTIIWLQYLPFFWQPPDKVNTPMLVLAGERDRVVSVHSLRRTAQHYHADFVLVDRAAHNLMMEPTHRHIAQTIHDWLSKQGIS